MANKKFLSKIKNQSLSSNIQKHEPAPTSVGSYEDDDLDLNSFGAKIINQDIEEKKVEEVKVPSPDLAKKIEASIDEDFGGTGAGRSIDLSNLPHIESLNFDEDEDVDEKTESTFSLETPVIPEVKIEKPVIEEVVTESHSEPEEEEKVEEAEVPKKRGRGRPKAIVIEEHKEEVKEIEKVEDIPEIPEVPTNTVETTQNYEVNYNGADTYSKVLNYVCNKTIQFLLENHKSKIYTADFAGKLFNDYLNGKIDATNPLFEELIGECLREGIKDPYLGDLTEEVLIYIKGRNV